MLFVMSAIRNIQKHRRHNAVVFSVMMIWSSLVAMNYAIYRYVLMWGGVQGIIWEVHSALITQRVVLSVKGCLMWRICEWGRFVSRKFVVLYFQSPEWVSWKCSRTSMIWQDSLAHGRMVQDVASSCFDSVGELWCVIWFFEANSWRDCNRL
jgi:hypothetical protein